VLGAADGALGAAECLGAEWVLASGAVLLLPVEELADDVVPAAPRFLPQTGHAPAPWPSRTFSATWICCDFEAFCGEPWPPDAA